MGATNQNKEQTCTKHRTYLEVIYHLGNKVMLLKQLFEYAKLMGITNTYTVFLGHIHELVAAEIIRQEPFTAYNKKTSLHMLTLKKYGLRYIEGKTSSNAVSAVPKANTNERILTSLFKNCYIIDKIIPRILKQETLVTMEMIMNTLANDISTILFKKNQGLDYINNFSDCLGEHIDERTMNYVIEDLKALRLKKQAGFEMGAKVRHGKGIGSLYSNAVSALDEVLDKLDQCGQAVGVSVEDKKQRKLDNYNIDSMMTAFIHIAQIKMNKGRYGEHNPTVTILVFDVNNKTDVYSLATQIACVYGMLRRYFKDSLKVKLNVGIISIDQDASDFAQREAKRIIRDPRTKELAGPLLEKTLASWHVSATDQPNIAIQFKHYDITNRFLDGKKHASLMRK